VLAKTSAVRARVELDVSRCICSCYMMESWVSLWRKVWHPARVHLFDGGGMAICPIYYVPDYVHRLDREAAPDHTKFW
jgi:hypothetical protein